MLMNKTKNLCVFQYSNLNIICVYLIIYQLIHIKILFSLLLINKI